MTYRPMDTVVWVRAPQLHRELWEDAADSAGVKLSAWIRSVLNAQVANRLAQSAPATPPQRKTPGLDGPSA